MSRQNRPENMTKEPSSSVQISLSADEAVVLFEFVRRYSDSDALTIVDQAEQRALWNLCCIFERGPLSSIEGDWPDLVREARDRLRDEC
jgi:hypothetical protein